MTEGFSVKGSSLRLKLDYIREVHGASVEAELKEWLKGKGVYWLLVPDGYPHQC